MGTDAAVIRVILKRKHQMRSLHLALEDSMAQRDRIIFVRVAMVLPLGILVAGYPMCLISSARSATHRINLIDRCKYCSVPFPI